ncbi:hypothetical protein J5J86_14135 [Aquabacter sp. L1I39]|uniref:hypothetical protein n=1 Tax=Aquabacter sp. L1I39 TaxID=2820278 RepID=UPI001AD9CF84|nr:hypothetical protein [Aquabacter sp. L1I39]QTL01945.1 hypothetical protein J5J86_14135 [Aquabacter sp. L1I39]
MVTLGHRVKDAITGLVGIATARTEYMYGCAQVHIQPEGLKDGAPISGAWFDEQRVSTVEVLPIAVSAQSSAGPGGDAPPPPARKPPSRY